MERDTTTYQTASADNARLVGFDVDVLRYHIPEWDALPREARRANLLDPPRGLTPSRVETVSNVTCDGWQEHLAHAATLDPSRGDELDGPGRLALGSDDSAFATTDTSLNNRLGSISITDPVSQGATFRVNEFLSSNELNGTTIRELGIESESGSLWNHAPTSQDWAKDQNLAILFQVEITMSDA